MCKTCKLSVYLSQQSVCSRHTTPSNIPTLSYSFHIYTDFAYFADGEGHAEKDLRQKGRKQVNKNQ